LFRGTANLRGRRGDIAAQDVDDDPGAIRAPPAPPPMIEDEPLVGSVNVRQHEEITVGRTRPRFVFRRVDRPACPAIGRISDMSGMSGAVPQESARPANSEAVSRI
jgi:hypothetical protein